MSRAIPGSVSLLLKQVQKEQVKKDAILTEGPADRCVSLGMSHKGG